MSDDEDTLTGMNESFNELNFAAKERVIQNIISFAITRVNVNEDDLVHLWNLVHTCTLCGNEFQCSCRKGKRRYSL